VVELPGKKSKFTGLTSHETIFLIKNINKTFSNFQSMAKYVAYGSFLWFVDALVMLGSSEPKIVRASTTSVDSKTKVCTLDLQIVVVLRL
jgi:hypothetical protein